MIETKIENYLTGLALAAYPDLNGENVIVSFSGGDFLYSRNKGRRVIGSEILHCAVAVDSAEPVDRREFIRLVGRKEIDFEDGYRAFQEYKRHEWYNYAEVTGLKRTVFYLDYTYDIEVD